MKTKSLLPNRKIIKNVQSSHEIKLWLEIWNLPSCCKPPQKKKKKKKKEKKLVAIHMLELYLMNHVKNVFAEFLSTFGNPTRAIQVIIIMEKLG